MAQLALGIAGAAVGSAFGMPQLGFLIGSTLGGLLFPEKIEYPPLEDLKLQDSTYGRPIPLVWGTMRVAGNVIWQTPELTKHQEKSGGKGGPEVTSYTYSASWAVGWVGNEILGYKRKWAAGRLVYDTSQSTGTSEFPFTRYLGTETQMPDATMEAILGAGEVTAHRGMAYTVYDDVYLTEFGNSIPLLEAEVYTAVGDFPYRVSTFDPTPDETHYAPCVTYLDGVITVGVYRDFGTYTTYFRRRFSMDGTEVEAAYSVGLGDNPRIHSRVENLQVAFGNFNGTQDSAWYLDGEYFTAIIDNPFQSGFQSNAAFGQAIYQNDFIYTIARNSAAGTAGVARWAAPSGIPTGTADLTYSLGVIDYSTLLLGTSTDGNVYLRVASTGALYELDAELNLLRSWDASETPANIDCGHNFHVHEGMMALSSGLTVSAFVHLVNVEDAFPEVGQQVSHYASYLIPFLYGYVLSTDGVICLLPTVAPAILGDIVADIAAKAGDTSPDVSALTDEVDGYVLNAAMSAKAAIDGLRSAYSFDGAEIDDQVVFVKRGGASVATITVDELAAREYGAEAPVALRLVRTSESELPRSVSVKFVNGARDYQIDTQYDRREVTSSLLDLTYDLPINMTAGKALAIAKKLLYEAWVERDHYTFSTHRKYARLVPTDVVTVDGIMMRIEKKTEAPNGVFTFEAIATLAEVYTQDEGATAGGSFTPQTPPGLRSATTLLLLDLPLIVDEDFSYGLYAAMGPSSDGPWSGAALYKSTDLGATWSAVASTESAATMGVVTGVLADHGGGDTFDESNIIEVTLEDAAATLESATELAVLNGANVAAVGREVIQFKTATLTGPGVYDVSGLLRGRRGTEWAQPGHTAGDRFVLMPVIDVNAPLSDMHVSRTYKPVTYGTAIADAVAQSFTNQGMRVKPYAPVGVGGGGNGAGNITINWTRRTRIGGDWLDYSDAPLSEESELYVLEIRNPSGVLVTRVIEGITSPTYVYTSAMQVTDFGADQSAVTVSVAQLGSFGIGTRAFATVAGDGATADEPIDTIAPYGSPPGDGPGPTNPVNFVMQWDASNSPHTTSGYVIGDTYVVEFTTDGDPVGPGNISAAEYGNPAYYRGAIISTDTGGVDVVAAASGNSVNFIFGTGTGEVSLSTSTTYYLIIRTQFPDGTPSGVLGDPANMIVSV